MSRENHRPGHHPENVAVLVHRLDPEQFAEAMKLLHKLTDGNGDERLHAAILQSLQALNGKVDRIMAVSQEIKTAMSRIDAATNRIAAKMADLASKVGTGMSQEDVDEVKAGLNAEAEKLEAMGADPANPVPPEPTP